MIPTNRRWTSLGGGLGLCLIGMGSLGVLVAERARLDHQRTAVLKRYDEAARPEASAAPWVAPLRGVDEALARKDIRAAERAWHVAYGAALGSGRWDGMVEVGEAHLRIGEAAGERKASQPRARWIYREALFRARSEGSLDGVLRTAEGFAALGDREVVEQCLRIAEGLALRVGDPEGRVHAFRERIGNGLSRVGAPVNAAFTATRGEP